MTNQGLNGFPSTAGGVQDGSLTASKLSPGLFAWLTSNQITSGEETIPRIFCATSSAWATQSLRLTYFTARKTEMAYNIATTTAGTQAAATPTLCRMGIYTVNSDGTLLLSSACASDTALFASTNTRYSRALTAPLAKVAGQRYAFGILVVSATTMPALYSSAIPFPSWNTSPTVAAQVTGQSDLPASIAVSSLAASGAFVYGEVTP